jgi:dihydroorotase
MTSPASDLLLTGGTVVTEDGEFPNAAVAITGGRIAAIGRASVMSWSGRRIDVTGKHVLPGVIDAHVHLREPGMTYKEDYASGTGAAALGGVTCVLDMPNTEPPTNTAARLIEKLAAVKGSAWTDYGMYGLISTGDFGHVEEMTRAGVIGFKAFLGQSEHGSGCPLPPDDGELYAAMTVLSTFGVRLAVHAENHDIMRWRIEEMKRAGITDFTAHRHSRPPVVEVEAIQRVGIFAQYTGCAVHIVHVSSGDGAMAVRTIRARGVDLTAETCPHYLLLDGDEALTNVQRRVNPPVRGHRDAAALRRALADRHLQLVASDHAPHSAAEKAGPAVWDVRAGLPGTQHLLQLLLGHREELALSLPDIVRVTSAEPARVWGLWPRKGSLAPGADGDLTVVDLDLPWTIDSTSIRAKSPYNPYLGWSSTGKAITTIVRGNVVADEGLLLGEPLGHWVAGCHACRQRTSGTVWSSRRDEQAERQE